MDNTTKSLLFICILTMGIFGYYYFNTDFSKKVIEYTNISISAEYNGQKKMTGYVVETNQGIIEGNTSQSYEKIRVEKNQIIKVYNKNIEGQEYYTDLREINITDDTQRITLKLEEQKEIKYNLINKKPIEILLESVDARDIDFCVDYSISYIYVKTNYRKIDNPIGYEKWNECYDGNFSLKNSNHTIQINYTEFKDPTSNDYFRVLIFNKIEDNILSKEIEI